MSTRCCSLKVDGTRCAREPVYQHHDFAWCWQHARIVRGESVHKRRRELDREKAS